MIDMCSPYIRPFFYVITCMDMYGLSVMDLVSIPDFLSQYYMQYTAMHQDYYS